MHIEWKSIWETGITEIDDQHKHLVEIINHLLTAMEEHKESEEFAKIMADLIEYTQTHFKSEEEYFEKHNYCGINEHKAQHKVLVKQIIHILNDVKHGKTNVPQELLGILKNWLIKHVQNYDIVAVKEIKGE